MNIRSTRSIVVGVAGLVALAILIAGCGSSSGGGSSASASTGGGYGGAKPSTAASTPAPAGSTSVKLASTGLGKVLVDAQGRTLYLFEADKGPTSMCSGSCASIWPPLTASGKPTAGTGLAAAKLGTTKRSDGTLEVTYNGHPLYTYAGDQSAGQTSGEGLNQFGAEWYALSAAGNKVEHG